MTLELVIFVSLACGVVGALIAQSKNRPPITGALFGVFLGLFGLLIMALLSKQGKEVR